MTLQIDHICQASNGTKKDDKSNAYDLDYFYDFYLLYGLYLKRHEGE